MGTFIQSVHLPGRFVNFLIIEKGIDKVKEMCYTLVTIKKGRIKNGKNLHAVSPLQNRYRG